MYVVGPLLPLLLLPLFLLLPLLLLCHHHHCCCCCHCVYMHTCTLTLISLVGVCSPCAQLLCVEPHCKMIIIILCYIVYLPLNLGLKDLQNKRTVSYTYYTYWTGGGGGGSGGESEETRMYAWLTLPYFVASWCDTMNLAKIKEKKKTRKKNV